MVRIGVHDYDPAIDRFTTPDPLFLEEPDLCLAGPVDCKLCGYARNRPLDFVDPERTNPVLIQQFLQRLGPIAQNAGPAVVQVVRQTGPAAVQAARQAGPAIMQAVRQAGPRPQTMRRQAVEVTRVNGQPLATFGYNALGQLDEVRFGSAGMVAFGYDPLTQERVSVAQTTAAQATSVGWRFNSRGLTDAEEVAIGASRWTRQYDCSAEGFLSAAEDAAATYAYTFDASGLPTSITEAGSTRTLVSHGDTLVAGSVVHTFDALGRTVMKGDLALAYGPNGQVETASRGGSSWRFLYDEDGQRLAKLTGEGEPLAAYLDDGSYLDASGLMEPVHVGGQLVGLLKNGVFQMLAVDRRGTVIADAGGTARLASPFGNRAVHPSDAAAVDYVEKGYDAELGVVRMGVRDYDPAINRFTTPDPLFLEAPDLCVGSPVDCNLYAYARNRPLDFVDPEGTNPYHYVIQIANRVAPIVQNAGPAVVQYARQVGPAVAQAVRTRGPAAVQAVRQAAPVVMQMARQAGARVQTMGKQAVEVSQRGAAQASHHARNAVEVTKRVIDKVAGKAQATAPSQPAAPPVTARKEAAITKGEQVTEQVIREAMKGAPLQSQQGGGVSLRLVQQYVDKLLAGDVAPAIKVDGQIIVDGNHRHIAGRILQQEPTIQSWAGGRGPVVPWDQIKISTEW
ncbi:RHS repeat-associated core domain-containing protein [Sorangium sp. So ce302]|uniref:RHS repeat-associated core domain-containing protein n=1 Tax=Sorangium sp. So ce302 TaxID=3133297 RepID=UPI003F615F48